MNSRNHALSFFDVIFKNMKAKNGIDNKPMRTFSHNLHLN